MPTAFFWLAWGVITFWALKTFYYSFSKEKVERLRKIAWGINLAVFILTLPSWFRFGRVTSLAFLFTLFLLTSLALLATKDATLLKIGVALTIINTFLLFIIMISLQPGTFTLTSFDIAPILATVLLLVSDVAVLLLWQQIDLRLKK